MTNVCIAGASHLGLITVFEVLQQAGMQLASPFHGDESIDMAQWHDQVLASAQQDGAVLQPVSSPGRHWSKLALDIFAANSGAQVWGWADRRSTWLLNFWQNFEPRTRFILVCGSPQHMLAAAITAAQDGVAVGALIDAWRSEHEQLLRFHHRNPECSVLVDATECANFPRKLVELCVNKWQLPLALESDPKSRKEEAEPLTLFLSQQLCRTHADALALQHEISATLARLGPPGVGGASGPEPFDPDDVVAQWHSLRMLAVTGPTVDPSAHTEPDALRDYVADLVAQHAQSVEASGQKLDEASRENELLLSALWQLQQELQAEQDTSLGRAEALDTATTNLQQAERNNVYVLLVLVNGARELIHPQVITNMSSLESFIDVGVTPVVKALTGYPALLGYDIINEPEGMAGDLPFPWVEPRVQMADIQRFVGRVAHAIHQANPDTLVSCVYVWNDTVLLRSLMTKLCGHV